MKELYYVATISRYDFVWATSIAEAIAAGEKLFNDIFTVRTVRLATKKERAEAILPERIVFEHPNGTLICEYKDGRRESIQPSTLLADLGMNDFVALRRRSYPWDIVWDSV